VPGRERVLETVLAPELAQVLEMARGLGLVLARSLWLQD